MKQNCCCLTNELFLYPSDKQKYMARADRKENKIQTEGCRKGKEENLENKDTAIKAIASLYSTRKDTMAINHFYPDL